MFSTIVISACMLFGALLIMNNAGPQWIYVGKLWGCVREGKSTLIPYEAQLSVPAQGQTQFCPLGSLYISFHWASYKKTQRPTEYHYRAQRCKTAMDHTG